MRCMSYSPDGVVLATMGEDGTFKIWIASSGLCYCNLSSHIALIAAVTFSSTDGRAQFFSLAIGMPLKSNTSVRLFMEKRYISLTCCLLTSKVVPH